jgi:hypothetical protein
MWLLAIVLIVLLYVYLSQWMDTVYRYAAGLALLGHSIVAIVVLPRIPYGWDIAKFHGSAVSILSGGIPEYATSVASFATFQSVIYTFSGTDPIALSIINGLLAVLVPFPLRYVMRKLYPELQTTHLPTLLILFLPLPFIMLTIPMREGLAILLFAILLALSVQAIVEQSIWSVIVALPLWGIVYLLRSELALILVVGGGAAVFVSIIDTVTDRSISLRGLFLSITPFGIIGFGIFTIRYPFEALQGKLSYRASGSAAYLESFQYTSWIDVIIAAPGRAIYFQYAPFPLHVNQVFHLLALSSLPILIILTIAAAFSLYESKTNRLTLVLLLVVYGAGIVGYGLIDSNFGTTARHRVSFVFLLVVFASPVLDHWWLKIRRTYDILNQPPNN